MLKAKLRFLFDFSFNLFYLLRFCCFLILFALLHLPCSSQVFDSIQSSLHKKPHPVVGFATKSTFIGGFRSPVFTARAGLDFDHRISMGIGVSWLKLSKYESGQDNTPFYLDKILPGPPADTVHPALQFSYINLFLEYVYYKKGRWQFSIPLQFGVGDSRYKFKVDGASLSESERVIFLYEPAVSGQYKILKWFGAGLDVGYRIMIVSNKNIGSKFNSPVYDIKAIIFWGELYNMVFRKE